MRPARQLSRNCVQRSSMACPKIALILRAGQRCTLFRTRGRIPGRRARAIPFEFIIPRFDENVRPLDGYIRSEAPLRSKRTWRGVRLGDADIWRLRPGEHRWPSD